MFLINGGLGGYLKLLVYLLTYGVAVSRFDSFPLPLVLNFALLGRKEVCRVGR